MSIELVNKVARILGVHVFGWDMSTLNGDDFTAPNAPPLHKTLANAAVATIQAVPPQDKPGSPARALRAAAAFIRFHAFDMRPCFTPKDEVVAMALRARQGEEDAVEQLLALVEGAEPTNPTSPPTPAEVLRAMTLAYQAAAFDEHIAGMKAHPEDRTARLSAKRYRRLLRLSKSLWDIAALVAGNADADPMVFPLLRDDPHLQSDYLARLTGQRAADAPPAET